MSGEPMREVIVNAVVADAYDGLIRIPGDGLGLGFLVVGKRVGWCAMSRGGEAWRGLLII